MKIDIGPFPDDDTPRQIDIEIHGYDTWNLDYSLGLVIVAALKKYIETPHGAPFIANEDVPPELHRPDDAEDWKTDESWHPRFEWVLNEMLWAFEYGIQDDDFNDPEQKQKEARAMNGRRLFAKYFHALWN